MTVFRLILFTLIVVGVGALAVTALSYLVEIVWCTVARRWRGRRDRVPGRSDRRSRGVVRH